LAREAAAATQAQAAPPERAAQQGRRESAELPVFGAQTVARELEAASALVALLGFKESKESGAAQALPAVLVRRELEA